LFFGVRNEVYSRDQSGKTNISISGGDIVKRPCRRKKKKVRGERKEALGTLTPRGDYGAGKIASHGGGGSEALKHNSALL